MDSTRHAADRGATSIPRGAHEPFRHARALRVCGARDDPRRRRRRAGRRDLRLEPLRAGADDPRSARRHTASTRGMAMVEGAVYDAVNALDPDYRPYLLDLEALHAQPFGSQAAAIATAAHDVLVKIVAPGPPVDAARTPSSRRRSTRFPTGRSKAEGIRVGAAAAAAMLEFRENDGYLAPFPFDIGLVTRATGVPSAGPSPPTGARPRRLGREREAVPRSRAPSQFRTKGPNELTSTRVREGLRRGEVARRASTARPERPTRPRPRCSGSSRRSRSGTGSPATSSRRGSASTRPTRRASTRSSTSPPPTRRSAAGTTSTTGSFWRPRAAIREAGTDGNPATVADPTWESLFAPTTQTTPPLGTPPFPDHPSGHGCVSGAVLNALADFFGSDKVEFDIVSGRSLERRPDPAAALRPLLGRAPGGRRSACLGRDPLPDRRRAGREDRQADRAVDQDPLLRAGALNELPAGTT